MGVFSTDRERQAVIDDLTASMLSGLRSRGMDLSRPVAAWTRLGFETNEQALRAGADLILSGWPGIRMSGTPTQGQGPRIELLYEMVLTVGSIRDVRRQLVAFVGERGGTVVGDEFGGESAFDRSGWNGPNQKQWERELEEEDQVVFDRLSGLAGGSTQPCLVTAGLGFRSERLARGAAADLFLTGWPEVHVVQSGPRWVVEAVANIVPGLAVIREMRRNLTRMAAVRSGLWYGFSPVDQRSAAEGAG